MNLRTKVALAATAMIAVPGLLFVATVSAHATIGSVAWDNPNNATKVIATSRGDDISTEAGTYGVQVFDPSGKEITAGKTVVTGPKTMEVAITKPTAQGQYRVAWKTESADDGDAASGNLSLQLAVVAGAPAAAAPAASAPAAVSPPSTGDGGLLAQSSNGLIALIAVAGATLGATALLRSRRTA